jgi:hypothetical protein
VFLFLARAVDGGLLPAFSSLNSQQANLTEKTMGLCKKFLDFMATQEEAILTYHTSKMVLAIHSNALYLSEPKARSQAGDHMFMAGNQQWGRSQHFTDNSSSHVIRSGGRIGCPVHQCKNRLLHTTNPHQTCLPATTHPDANRQCHSTRTTHQQNITHSTQGHGHVFPLATMQQRPRTIPLLLETWHTKFGRLLHKASPYNTPQVCTPNNPHVSQRSRIQETLPEHRRLHKIGGHK